MSLQEEIARSMPAIRSAFDGVKTMLQDGRMNAAASSLCGNALLWGEELKDIYANDDRDHLARRDPLTRFFVCRFRGMPKPAEITGAPPEAAFLMAFNAFPYLDALVDEMTIGDHVGFDEDGFWLVKRLVAGEDGGMVKVCRGPVGWKFDLMSVYSAKAAALADFIAAEYAGDFDAFLWRYVAEHDLAFDVDQAWRPIAA